MARPKLEEREETLRKALSFFWKHGYSGGSTRDLGRALGMHPGSIYSSFESKEKLYLEAIDLYGRQMRERFDACMEGTDFFSGLTEFLNGVVSRVEHPCTCFLSKTFSSRLSSDQLMTERARELVNDFRSHIATHISRAQERGGLSAEVDPGAFSALIQAQIMGLSSLADSEPGEEVLQKAVNNVVEMLRVFQSRSI